MKLYNTPEHKVVEFKPQDPKRVKMYSCGPTVYGYQHIGNYAAYIYWDLLVRALQTQGYNVDRIINFTDVGHLASDADDGEDKMEKGAKREGKTVWEIAEFYEKDFLENYRALNLIEPTKFAPATEYIKQDIDLVDRLTEKGYTYETKDGIYYDTSKFPDYAKFAHLDLEHLQAGARIEFNEEKRNISDFAVWKFIQPGEDHAMQWEYLGRPGYPGWHLECSTIIHTELGEPIDIHAGGIDHVPIHHTNEIAQSTAAFDKPLSNYWVHCNFITIEGEKVSKSLGNTYTLADLAEKGFSPMDYKMWVLQGHYQSDRNFTFEDLAAAKQRRLNWRNKIALLRQNIASDASEGGPEPRRGLARDNRDDGLSRRDPEEVLTNILSYVENNLNSAGAFALIDGNDFTMEEWQKIDELFGLNLIADSSDITAEQKDLIAKREAARAEKDFATADKLRDELAQQNLTVKDTPNGPVWQYLN